MCVYNIYIYIYGSPQIQIPETSMRLALAMHMVTGLSMGHCTLVLHCYLAGSPEKLCGFFSNLPGELRWAKSPIANRQRSANAVNSRKPFRTSMWN